MADMGYSEATPIQAGAIPIVLQGRDLIGCASTGTGKTAAFLLPVLQLLNAGDHGRCRALVLSPTRELALQIDEQALALGYHLGLSAAAVVGGLEMGPQERALRAGAAIVVATPGRLLDHMRFDYVDLSAIEIVVLDEADRMLDMGFLPDIRRILNALPKKRQTLMFSATMSPTIRRLAEDILIDPAEVTVDRQAPASLITQTLHPVLQERKTALLTQILKQEGMESVIVFVRRKIDVNQVAGAIRRVGIDAGAIHSGRTQEDRIAALEGFRSGRHPVLVATDVAARGLDVSGISHVINFDVPHSPEDYIHRAGRTARAGATGDVITFVSPGEEDRLRDIEREIGTKLPRTVVPGFEYDEALADGGRGGSRGRGRGRTGGPSSSSPGRERADGGAPRGRGRGRGGRGEERGAEEAHASGTETESAAMAAAPGGAIEPAELADVEGPSEGGTEGAPRRRRRRGGRGRRREGAEGQAEAGTQGGEGPVEDRGATPREARPPREPRAPREDGQPREDGAPQRRRRRRGGASGERDSSGQAPSAEAGAAQAPHRRRADASASTAATSGATGEPAKKKRGLRDRLVALAATLTGRGKDSAD